MGSTKTVARGSRQVQMNTRIDEGLKERGDAALHRLGYSPSEAVRGLWRYAVERQDDPDAIRAVLGGERNNDVERRVSALAVQQERYAQCAAELGIAAGARDDLPSWSALRDEWYDERLERAGEV